VSPAVGSLEIERTPCPVCDGFDCTGHGAPLDLGERAFQEWGADAVAGEPADFVLPHDVSEKRFHLGSKRPTTVLVGRAGQKIRRSEARRLIDAGLLEAEL
jgi:hypothetical protein